ncbi:MAG: hypothetical protein MUF49_15695 [Oculatellaceae cyanobacterium Prado106]|jgi:hypothetical protein|nr:hypothetical protein [Oculatellaceae cyanobacterium Prado106]
MQTQSSSAENLPLAGHLSPQLAEMFLSGLPEHIQAGLKGRAETLNYPIWAVIEMAIAGYLDDEALSFVDCQPKLD